MQVTKLEQALAQKLLEINRSMEALLNEYNEQKAERDEWRRLYNEAVKERDELSDQYVRLDHTLKATESAVRTLKNANNGLRKALDKRDERIIGLRKALDEKDTATLDLHKSLAAMAEANEELHDRLDGIARMLWNLLGDVPIDDKERLDESFLIFAKGTDREAVWHWFEDVLGASVHDLMYKEKE